MTSTALDKPIFIIGAARSGTTLLGEILSQHQSIAYWLEPKYIWRYGHPSASHDVRTAPAATPKVARYISSRFSRFTQKRKKKRFLEKTPSNIFRVGFVHKIFPDARFVQIIRNGNDVTLSAEKKWTSPPSGSAIKRRLMSNEIPLVDLPYYLGAGMRDVVGRFLFPKRGYVWGPQFEGMAEYRRSHSVIETCAQQWVESCKSASESFAAIPEENLVTIRYEELIQDTEKTLGNVLDFLELDSEGLIQYAQTYIKPSSRIPYTKEAQEKIKIINPIISEQMSKYGYSLN